MKVVMKPYPKWVGPYQLTEFLVKLGLSESNREKVVDVLDKIGITTLCNNIHSFLLSRRVRVKIHNYDSWGAYNTLGFIILPILKQLKETKHGSPNVDDMDVPDHLRSTAAKPADKENGEVDDLFHKRWDYVLDEMIWAFEQLETDWEDQYWKIKPELDLSSRKEDEGKEVVEVNWLQKGECDWEGRNRHAKRMEQGFMLFGKYYQCLWD